MIFHQMIIEEMIVDEMIGNRPCTLGESLTIYPIRGALLMLQYNTMFLIYCLQPTCTCWPSADVIIITIIIKDGQSTRLVM